LLCAAELPQDSPHLDTAGREFVSTTYPVIASDGGSLDEDMPSAEPAVHSKAVADLARDHHWALVRYIAKQTGSHDDAQELVQEAYARMLALDQPHTVSFVAGYLWRIALNLASKRKRQRATRARLDQTALCVIEQHTPSAETVVSGRQRIELLERAISELPPRCLEAFILGVLEDCSTAEIARRMGIGDRTARMYLARALEYCQTCLDAAESTGSDPQ
jgi:RNA polymerase sigma factor (sigma-70 family)